MSPRPDVSAARRAQIAQAALTCFARKGYNNTTMDEIAVESGLSKGSLYWYFESKEALFKAAILSFFENSFGQDAIAGLEQIPTASAKLRVLAAEMARLSQWAEGLFNLFLEFWASSERRDEAAQLWTDMLLQYKEVIVGIVEQGIASGEFRPLDAEGVVWAMMAAYDGLTAYVMLMPQMDVAKVSEAFIETLLHGLVAPERPQEAA